MSVKRPPELTFQDHIAEFLVREHKYGVLEQTDITDTENVVVEDHLWAFLNDTQAEAVKRLTQDYGTDARDEVFRALRNELRYTPLWLLLRNGLKVRGAGVSTLLSETSFKRKRCDETVREESHHLPSALLLRRHQQGD
jgi:type I restriction enzyme R subunit